MNKLSRLMPLAALLLILPHSAPAENLTDIFKLAQANDPQFQSELANFNAIQEAYPQARALLLPSLSAGASKNRSKQDIQRSFFPTSGIVETKNWGLNLTQPVFHYDRLIGLHEADSRIKQAEALVSFARQDLILRTAERYFDVLAADDDEAFTEAESRAIERQLEQAKQRFDVGLIAITDVEEAQAAYDLATARNIQAINALDNSRENLREISGVHHKQIDKLIEAIPFSNPEPDDIDQWTETALANNRQVAAARYAAETSRSGIKRQQAGHYPTLDLVGNHAWSDQTGGSFGNSESTVSTLELQLNLPLYQGGLVNSRVREAESRHNEARFQLEKIQREVYRQTRSAFLGVKASISQVKALEQAVKSSHTALDAVRAGFQVGTRTTVDVLNAERALLSAQRDASRARYDFILASLRLRLAAGSLAPDDIDWVNRWLHPVNEQQTR